jgi:proline iminopeptidase
VRKAALEAGQRALMARWGERLEPHEVYFAQHAAESPRFWYDASHDAARVWRDVPVNLGLIATFRRFFADATYRVSWDEDRMRAPVLAMSGRFDFVSPPVTWDEVRALQRNLTFRRFDWSGHMPQVEEPELFERTLTTWMRHTASTILPM